MVKPAKKKTKSVKHKNPKEKINTKQKSTRSKLLLSLAGILLLSIIVFSGSVNGDILNWDDDRYLADNEHIRELSSENIKTIFSEFYFGNYHPITTLSYAIEYSLFELDPKPYHVDNLILHLLNIVLVFFFIYLLIGRIDVSSIIAIFFAVHPMHVESVAWISERKDLLYALFYIASLISYFFYLKSYKQIKYLILSLIFFILSLMSKSAAVTLPVILILMDYYMNKKYTLRLALEKIPFFLLSILFGILAMLSQNIDDAAQVIANFNFFDRIFLVSYSVMFYIVKMFAPINLSAIHFYPDKAGGSLPIEFYLAPLAILLLIWMIYKAKTFRRELLFGALFFIVTISIVLQLVPIGRAIVSERYTYIPYLGLFFIVGQFYNYTLNGKFSFSSKIKSYTTYVMIAYVVLFSLISWNRVALWENGVKLFSDAIEKYPDKYYGYWSRGNSYKNEGDFKAAMADYSQVIKLKPDFYEAYTNRGYIKYLLQNYDEAIADYEKAIEVYPENAEAYNNLGLVYSKMKSYYKAIEKYDKAIELDSSYAVVFYNRGLAKHNLSDFKEAIKDYDLSLNVKSDQHSVLLSKGLAHFAMDELEDAENAYSLAIEVKPDFAEAYNYRGVTRARLQNFQDAVNDFSMAISIKADYSEAYFNRGLAQLKTGNANGACYDWRKAVQFGNTQAQALLARYCK